MEEAGAGAVGWHCRACTGAGGTGKHVPLLWESVWVLVHFILCVVFNACLFALCVKPYLITIKARCCQEHVVGSCRTKLGTFPGVSQLE